jgi:hypothetical protein
MTNSKTDKEVELAEKEKQVLERISNEACDFIVKIVRDGLFWCLGDKLCIVMEFSQVLIYELIFVIIMTLVILII